MKDYNKTKKQLIHELTALRSQNAVLEKSITGNIWAELVADKVTPGETIGSFIYDLGNKQWDIPKLRELLEEVLPEKEAFVSPEWITRNIKILTSMNAWKAVLILLGTNYNIKPFSIKITAIYL